MLPTRSKHKVASDFQTSLEEAAVGRPGRKAGLRNDHTLERRRCGTGIMPAGADIARFGEARPLCPATLPPMTEAIRPPAFSMAKWRRSR
jgi:hypothetical protein